MSVCQPPALGLECSGVEVGSTPKPCRCSRRSQVFSDLLMKKTVDLVFAHLRVIAQSRNCARVFSTPDEITHFGFSTLRLPCETVATRRPFWSYSSVAVHEPLIRTNRPSS